MHSQDCCSYANLTVIRCSDCSGVASRPTRGRGRNFYKAGSVVTVRHFCWCRKNTV